MHNKPLSRRLLSVLCLLFMLFGMSAAQAQTSLDFSVLDESNPASTLSVTEGYQAALSDGGWTSVHSASGYRWTAPYQDNRFQQSVVTFRVPDGTTYATYLVSPAIDLGAIAGKQLSTDWSAASVKGDITMQMLVIDKAGNTLATLGEVTGVPGSKNTDWTNVRYAIPASLTGTGFIAFATQSNDGKNNRASFCVRNIEITDGSAEPTVRVTPDALEFSETGVGEVSYDKTFNVVVANYDKAPVAVLSDGDTQDFTLVADQLTAEGGSLTVYFTPKSAGQKQATITITAGLATAQVVVTGTATGSGTADKPAAELLNDQYFYEFNSNRPIYWQTSGLVRQLEESYGFNSSTGYAVGITTGAAGGYLRQTIDLTAKDKEVEAGDEVECLIHYFTVASSRADGPFRLALRWLDSEGNELLSSERDLINNPTLYFGRHNTWGTLKFRTTCPTGAVKLEFGVEVAPNSEVRLDDFSAMRLDNAGKTPLVAILPQYLTLNGEVGVAQEHNIVMQGSHLSETQMPNISGNNALKSLLLNPAQLPANGTVKSTFTFIPQQKGAYTGTNVYRVSFGGADDENTGSLAVTAYVKAAGTTPAVALAKDVTVKEMQAEPGATDTQLLDFEATDIISSVNLSIEQPAGGPFRINNAQFFYSKTSDRLLNHAVTVTFAPKQAGTYDAVLRLVTPLADTLRIALHGVSTTAEASTLVERFTREQTMDPRFTGEAWNNYHKFDRGYWRLDGTFNGASDVTLNQGSLYFDELIADGVDKLTLYPVASAQVAGVEYSVDGGGHWTMVNAADADGNYTVGTHRPTLVRIVNATDTPLKVDSVSIQPANSAQRQAFASIEEGMLRNADKEPLALLNETFTGLRHTRILGLEGWQNLTLRGERPFYAWQQRDASQTTVENEVAQISFYRYATEDPREQETWLVSPTLSYKQAAGKTLTFRLRFANPVENGGEQFGFYIITEKNGVPAAHYVDLTSMVPEGVTVEAENWYDYTLDLSKADSLDIDDLFHIAFSFYSPQGGSATTLNFMVDDVTFGRTDLPTISADNQYLIFNAIQGVSALPQTFNVTTTNAVDPVTVLLVPSTADNYFSVSANTLPAAGGSVEVGFKTDDANDHAAMALLQTRGAASVAVRLYAHVTTPTGINNVEGKEGIGAYIENGSLHVNGTAYSIYTAAGQLLLQGKAQATVSLQSLTKGILIVKVADGNDSKVVKLVNE